MSVTVSTCYATCCRLILSHHYRVAVFGVCFDGSYPKKGAALTATAAAACSTQVPGLTW